MNKLATTVKLVKIAGLLAIGYGAFVTAYTTINLALLPSAERSAIWLAIGLVYMFLGAEILTNAEVKKNEA